VAEHAVFAEREKDLMYRELNHRIKNTFSIVQAILRLQGRSASEEVRAALESSISRCNAIFYAHDHISEGARAGTVEMRSYLTTLGKSLADALRDIRPIAITVDSDSVILPSEKAEPVGLIVNELVTNAFKYAFPKNQAGTIRIRFATEASGYRLEVTDNGSGCPAEVKTGLGTTLTQMLAQQIAGKLHREDAQPGCRVTLWFS
jgi:two-component sensor histidine kinase